MRARREGGGPPWFRKALLKAIAKQNFMLILLVVSAFLVMAAVSYVFVGAVVKNRINFYSGKEVALYRNTLESLIRSNEDALVHAVAAVVLALGRGADAQELLETVRTLNAVYGGQTDLQGVFASVYGFIDGDFIDSAGVVPGTFFNPRSAAWLRGAIMTRGLHHSQPYFAQGSREAVVAVSQVVYDEQGEYRGVMAVDFKLEPIVKRVTGFKLGQSGYGFLLSGDMLVLAHPDGNYAGKPVGLVPGLNALTENLLDLSSGGVAIGSFTLNGIDHIAFMSRLDNGWFMGSVSPLS